MTKRCDECGFPEVAPLNAARGDLVMIRALRGNSLGICVGAKVAARTDDGLEFVGVRDVLRAWRI
jgi:hypothetical protein